MISFFVYCIQSKEFFKSLFYGEVGVKDWTKTVLATPIYKDPRTSIRKAANELKLHEKTVKTAIK